jgi:hypothetical protein
MSEEQFTPIIPPRRIAVIIDDVIQDVLFTDERLAALFLSEPTIVDITDEAEDVNIGFRYDKETNSFPRG